MSLREFAAHLGVNDAAVSNWERRGELARLRYHTQELLDTDLSLASSEVRERFGLLLQDVAALDTRSAGNGSHAGSGTAVSAVADLGGLGAGSSARTRGLVETLRPRLAGDLTYLPPSGARERSEAFVSSTARVFVVTGPSGAGKTRLTYHLAESLTGMADVQLHTTGSLDLPGTDLATQILRYASLPAGEDALLTLESACALLERPLLVLVDGIASRDDLDDVGRQLDAVLRQVAADQLRFVLLARTPPDVDLTGYPVVAASTTASRTVAGPAIAGVSTSGGSWLLGAWSEKDAREVWNTSRAESTPDFDALPVSVRGLIRLPQYMHLVRAADLNSTGGPDRPDGPARRANAFGLVSGCVQAIVRSQIRDYDAALGALTALAVHQLGHLIPEGLAVPTDDTAPARENLTALAPDLPQILRATASGGPEFAHDILRELLLATVLSERIADLGHSLTAVTAMNDLAATAGTSAAARQVFELLVQRLDEVAPDLLTGVALAPTTSAESTLPLLLGLTSTTGRFATAQVWTSAARRCRANPSPDLARALLAGPALREAMGADHSRWLLDLLGNLGLAIWPEAATLIEQTLDTHAVRHLLQAADLDTPAEATFLARHVYLFLTPDQTPPAGVEVLLSHPDWRARAALAEGLGDPHTPHSPAAESLTATLVHDPDYKVRAAVAATLATRNSSAAAHTRDLLTDENWYVRERALDAVTCATDADLPAPATSASSEALARWLLEEESWQQPPAHVAPLLQRLLLQHGLSGPDHLAQSRHRAVFLLLREQLTGRLTLPDRRGRALRDEAQASSDWLVRHEADATLDLRDETRAGALPAEVSRRQAAYRRLRGQRHLQVALDMHDLDEALTVATEAVQAGADFLEVGDPLIKRVGLGAVAHLKQHLPGALLVVEMMSSDWGRDQVILAAQAGADVVLLIGPASTSSVSAAVEAGRRLGVPILLDAGQHRVSRAWVRDMERAGVDGLAVTTNIDLGIAGRDPLNSARILRSWTQLPVAITGGFSPTDHTLIASPDWDVLIVGRHIADATDPATAARAIADLVHRTPWTSR
jgi:3-keto-L-gulonate-6-phosphate decarboxylase